MSTSTRWTEQEGPELDALRMTGVLLDPSEADQEAALRSGQARMLAELGSSAVATDRRHRDVAGAGRLRTVAAPADRGDGRRPADGRRSGAPRRTGGSRRPGVRAAVGMGLVASVAGGLLLAPTATLSMPWTDGDAVPPGSASAAEILQDAATRTVAAADDSWDHVEGDQFVYYSTTGTSRYDVTGESVTKSSEDYQGWYSVDGTQDGRAVATYSVGDPLDQKLFSCADGGEERARAAGTDCSSEPGLDVDAPTDAGAMYDYLRQESDGSATSMFFRAGNLLSTLTPEARAAVFGALSQVDGLVVTPDVTDAIGRPGIAVGVETDDYRQDLVFDPETHDLLGGANAYPDGMTDGYAITAWTIVDQPGQTP